MNVRAFYKHAPSEIAPSVRKNTDVFDVHDELKKLKNELEATKNENEKRNIKRKIARLEKFSDTQEGKLGNPEKKDEIQKILKGKNTENYLGSDLRLLQKRGIDIVSLTLVSESDPSHSANSTEMKTRDSFVVNFGGNESLARKIGAGDILPPEITKVKINGVECERRNIPRPGYYNDTVNPSYQKIYDGYKIEVIERKDSISPEETKLAEDAAEKRWKKIRIQDMVDSNDGNPIAGLNEEKTLFSEVSKFKQQRLEIQKNYLSSSGERVIPGSSECIQLFSDACRYAGIEESWATNPDLYTLLEKESGGYVGRLNYTLQNMTVSDFKNLALNGERISAKSSASGLGQLLLSNIDSFYPSGRNGIGNAFEEAVGMVRYIENRYGDPSTALSMHGKTGTYHNSSSGFTLTKSFQEGY